MTTTLPDPRRRPSGAGNATPVDTRREPYWSRPTGEIFKALGSAATGLTQSDASRILRRLGPNQIDAMRSPSALQLLARQFLSPILLILIVATALSAL